MRSFNQLGESFCSFGFKHIGDGGSSVSDENVGEAESGNVGDGFTSHDAKVSFN